MKVFVLLTVLLLMLCSVPVIADVTISGTPPANGKAFSGTITDANCSFVIDYSSSSDNDLEPTHTKLWQDETDLFNFEFFMRLPYKACPSGNMARFRTGDWEARVSVAYVDPFLPGVQIWTPTNNFHSGNFIMTSVPNLQVSFANMSPQAKQEIGSHLNDFLTSELYGGRTLLYYKVQFCVKNMVYRELGSGATPPCCSSPAVFDGEFKIYFLFNASSSPFNVNTTSV